MATRTWFITGAASGFGGELTARLLARGDRVAATYLNHEPPANLSEKYGEQHRR
jgi:NAD(P)-dependent dehydrogenase (short-subunit alcohol dehydrogenase family)